jgi:SAM-dependent methyltransferase
MAESTAGRIAVADLARRLGLQRWFFTLAYRRGRTPWDTGVTPPELVRVVEGTGPERMSPGRALDLGCGTGTNCLFLARHGWDATGIDFAGPAIARARHRLAQAGKLLGAVRFLRGDVTRLDALGVRGPYDMVFDLGCFHGIDASARGRYAAGVTRLARPGALLLIYALAPTQLGTPPVSVGLTEDQMRQTFAAGWTLEHVETGEGRNGRASAWYWLRRAR